MSGWIIKITRATGRVEYRGNRPGEYVNRESAHSWRYKREANKIADGLSFTATEQVEIDVVPVDLEVELAYRVAGEQWKRKIFKKQSALEKFCAGLDEKHGQGAIEYRFSTDSGGSLDGTYHEATNSADVVGASPLK